MRIVCPSCGVAYQVPAALLAKRQTLKCSVCGTKWHIHAQPEATAAHEAPPEPTAPVSITRPEPAASILPSAPPASFFDFETEQQAAHPVGEAAEAPSAPHAADAGTEHHAPTTPLPDATPSPEAERAVQDPDPAPAREEVEPEAAPVQPMMGDEVEEHSAQPPQKELTNAEHNQHAPEPEPEPEPEQPSVTANPEAEQPQQVKVAQTVEAPSVAAVVPENATYFAASAALREAEQDVGSGANANANANAGQVAHEVQTEHAAPSKPAWQRMDIGPQIGAFKNGLPQAYQAAEQENAGLTPAHQQFVQKLQNTVLPLLAQDRFWRMAWVVSFIAALAVIIGIWCWWDSIVQVWPAAGRLHSSN